MNGQSFKKTQNHQGKAKPKLKQIPSWYQNIICLSFIDKGSGIDMPLKYQMMIVNETKRNPN